MPRHHYFDRPAADPADEFLWIAIQRGDVPPRCLLGGQIVHMTVRMKRDPCASCNGPRARCGGRPRLTVEEEAQGLDQARIRAMLTGEDDAQSVISALVAGRSPSPKPPT